ncbi:MAG: LD-carboxypeptidase [Victivallaceae bacterium]|nr:LD-carboxypeptidase [Victivallaceae bacterium]
MKRWMPSGIRSVAVVAPSGPASPEKVAAGVAALRRCGVHCKLGAHVLTGSSVPYLAASDEERLSDFNTALQDPQIDGIICVRGGYGSMRILSGMDWDTLRERRLFVAGYSDITALHWAMIRKDAGIPIAAPMVAKLADLMQGANAEFVRETMYCAYAGEAPSRSFSLKSYRGADAAGTMLAGNLTVGASLAGSEYLPDGANRILVLEDVGESLYRLDRMLTQLRLAGGFRNASAVVFGQFTQCAEPEELDELFQRFAGEVDCPVYGNFPFGHVNKFCSLNLRMQGTIRDGVLSLESGKEGL